MPGLRSLVARRKSTLPCGNDTSSAEQDLTRSSKYVSVDNSVSYVNLPSKVTNGVPESSTKSKHAGTENDDKKIHIKDLIVNGSVNNFIKSDLNISTDLVSVQFENDLSSKISHSWNFQDSSLIRCKKENTSKDKLYSKENIKLNGHYHVNKVTKGKPFDCEKQSVITEGKSDCIFKANSESEGYILSKECFANKLELNTFNETIEEGRPKRKAAVIAAERCFINMNSFDVCSDKKLAQISRDLFSEKKISNSASQYSSSIFKSRYSDYAQNYNQINCISCIEKDINYNNENNDAHRSVEYDINSAVDNCNSKRKCSSFDGDLSNIEVPENSESKTNQNDLSNNGLVIETFMDTTLDESDKSVKNCSVFLQDILLDKTKSPECEKIFSNSDKKVSLNCGLYSEHPSDALDKRDGCEKKCNVVLQDIFCNKNKILSKCPGCYKEYDNIQSCVRINLIKSTIIFICSYCSWIVIKKMHARKI